MLAAERSAEAGTVVNDELTPPPPSCSSAPSSPQRPAKRHEGSTLREGGRYRARGDAERRLRDDEEECAECGGVMAQPPPPPLSWT